MAQGIFYRILEVDPKSRWQQNYAVGDICLLVEDDSEKDGTVRLKEPNGTAARWFSLHRVERVTPTEHEHSTHCIHVTNTEFPTEQDLKRLADRLIPYVVRALATPAPDRWIPDKPTWCEVWNAHDRKRYVRLVYSAEPAGPSSKWEFHPMDGDLRYVAACPKDHAQYERWENATPTTPPDWWPKEWV